MFTFLLLKDFIGKSGKIRIKDINFIHLAVHFPLVWKGMLTRHQASRIPLQWPLLLTNIMSMFCPTVLKYRVDLRGIP